MISVRCGAGRCEGAEVVLCSYFRWRFIPGYQRVCDLGAGVRAAYESADAEVSESYDVDAIWAGVAGVSCGEDVERRKLT